MSKPAMNPTDGEKKRLFREFNAWLKNLSIEDGCGHCAILCGDILAAQLTPDLHESDREAEIYPAMAR